MLDMDAIINISLGIVLAALAYYFGKKTRR
jgi:hypothetical protein